MTDDIKWRRANDRWFAYQNEYQVGAVFPGSDGEIKVWVWPTSQAEKKWLKDCLTINRAKGAVEDML